MNNPDYHYKSENRTTTCESMESALLLLKTNDRDVFVEAYHAATHDDGGLTQWNLMYTGKNHRPEDRYKKDRL